MENQRWHLEVSHMIHDETGRPRFRIGPDPEGFCVVRLERVDAGDERNAFLDFPPTMVPLLADAIRRVALDAPSSRQQGEWGASTTAEVWDDDAGCSFSVRLDDNGSDITIEYREPCGSRMSAYSLSMPREGAIVVMDSLLETMREIPAPAG